MSILSKEYDAQLEKLRKLHKELDGIKSKLDILGNSFDAIFKAMLEETNEEPKEKVKETKDDYDPDWYAKQFKLVPSDGSELSGIKVRLTNIKTNQSEVYGNGKEASKLNGISEAAISSARRTKSHVYGFIGVEDVGGSSPQNANKRIIVSDDFGNVIKKCESAADVYVLLGIGHTRLSQGLKDGYVYSKGRLYYVEVAKKEDLELPAI